MLTEHMRFEFDDIQTLGLSLRIEAPFENIYTEEYILRSLDILRPTDLKTLLLILESHSNFFDEPPYLLPVNTLHQISLYYETLYFKREERAVRRGRAIRDIQDYTSEQTAAIDPVSLKRFTKKLGSQVIIESLIPGYLKGSYIETGFRGAVHIPTLSCYTQLKSAQLFAYMVGGVLEAHEDETTYYDNRESEAED